MHFDEVRVLDDGIIVVIRLAKPVENIGIAQRIEAVIGSLVQRVRAIAAAQANSEIASISKFVSNQRNIGRIVEATRFGR